MTSPPRVGLALLAAALLAGAGLLLANGPGRASHAPRSTSSGPRTIRRLARLSPRQLAGQRVIYSYRGLTPPRSLLAQVRAGAAAGVIFFADNISSRTQIRRVIGTLQRAAAHSAVKEPLLMMTDQEGGQVRRLAGAPALSQSQIGASARPTAAARAAGGRAGRNLTGVGVNVNLAPVLGVHRAPGDFLDRYGRSYGATAEKVARLGAAFIRAQQQTGVAATAKHFPGLGAATGTQDTDAGPVRLGVSEDSLRSIDERPYRSAVSAGVRLVMVSWATYPALDPHRPAGLSSTVIERELRGRLGFAGVTVTDALSAGALRAYGPTGRRAVLAAAAGMDLLLCAGQHVREGTSARSALATALDDGRLDPAKFTASAERVLSLRATLR